MSTIWGLTWIPIQVGVQSVPPLMYAGSRFLVAGLLLSALFGSRTRWSKLVAQRRDLFIVSILLVPACYAPLYWGIGQLPSAIAAAINLGLLPAGLFAIGLAMGAERFTRSACIGVILGGIGISFLFLPGAEASAAGLHTGGILAVTAGTLSVCLGTVLARKKLKDLRPEETSGAILAMGGLVLLAASMASEPWSLATARAFLAAKVLASWLFLVFGGSVVAFTLYLRLVSTAGPVRAGLYAFISPIVALAAGSIMLGERPTPLQLLACGLLLASAAFVLGSRAAPTPSGRPTVLQAK